MRFVLIFLFVSIFYKVNSQVVANVREIVITDGSGSPLKLKGGNNIEGSPYYKAEYCSANILSTDYQLYKNVSIKLNLEDNKVVFLSSAGEEMVGSFDIKRIDFNDCMDKGKKIIFESGFPSTGVQGQNSLYQVLDSGKVRLLKYIQVVQEVNKVTGLSPGLAGLTYGKIESYYIFSESKGILKLTKNADGVTSLLSDKQKEVTEFITTNKLKFRKEDDFIRVIAFYNSL